ncbi:MAG: hypothetical protein EA379_08090, partial [Phycisphaerales bacterium]
CAAETLTIDDEARDCIAQGRTRELDTLYKEPRAGPFIEVRPGAIKPFLSHARAGSALIGLRKAL